MHWLAFTLDMNDYYSLKYIFLFARSQMNEGVLAIWGKLICLELRPMVSMVPIRSLCLMHINYLQIYQSRHCMGRLRLPFSNSMEELCG